MNYMNYYKKQKGMGTVDIMVSMVIVSLIIAAIVAVTGLLRSRAEIQNAVTQHNALYTGVQGMYTADPNYLGVSNTRALSSGTTVPKVMRSDDNSDIKHVWSVVDSGVLIAESDNGLTFTVTYTDIPGEVCSEFTNAIRETAQQTFVNTTEVSSSNDVADNCTIDDDTNQVDFVYN